jgi:hypothetical protein
MLSKNLHTIFGDFMQNIILSVNEALDSTQNWKENSEEGYCNMVKQIIQSDPFEGHKFYIYQFVKRVDDVSGIKKMYHHARLTKPDPLPGSTLLRADPRDPDNVTIIWTLPNEETFGLYGEGKLFADPFVYECIQKFLKTPRSLMQKEEGDLPEDRIREIYKNIKQKKMYEQNKMKKISGK